MNSIKKNTARTLGELLLLFFRLLMELLDALKESLSESSLTSSSLWSSKSFNFSLAFVPFFFEDFPNTPLNVARFCCPPLLFFWLVSRDTLSSSFKLWSSLVFFDARLERTSRSFSAVPFKAGRDSRSLSFKPRRLASLAINSSRSVLVFIPLVITGNDRPLGNVTSPFETLPLHIAALGQ